MPKDAENEPQFESTLRNKSRNPRRGYSWALFSVLASLATSSFMAIKGCFDRERQEFFVDLQRANIPALKRDLDHNPGDVSRITADGWTPLMIAITNGNSDVVNLLLKAGADVNAKRTTGTTALMTAAQYGRADLAKLLLHHGAMVNAKCETGLNALMIGACWGRLDVVKVLLAAGATPRDTTVDLKSAADIVCRCGIGLSPCPRSEILSTLAHPITRD